MANNGSINSWIHVALILQQLFQNGSGFINVGVAGYSTFGERHLLFAERLKYVSFCKSM
jgi:hypothetical protein